MDRRIIDFISYPYDDETRRQILQFYFQKGTLLDAELLQEHLMVQPVLAALLLILTILAFLLLLIAIVFIGCRALGKCGAKRYQPHPTSGKRYSLHLVIFACSWFLLITASTYYAYCGMHLWKQKPSTSLIPAQIEKTTVTTNFHHSIRKRSNDQNVSDLFNNADYQGDFEQMENGSTAPAFVTDKPDTTYSPEPESSFVFEEDAPPALRRLPIHPINYTSRAPTFSTVAAPIEIPARPKAEIEFAMMNDGAFESIQTERKAPISGVFVVDGLPRHAFVKNPLRRPTSSFGRTIEKPLKPNLLEDVVPSDPLILSSNDDESILIEKNGDIAVPPLDTVEDTLPTTAAVIRILSSELPSSQVPVTSTETQLSSTPMLRTDEEVVEKVSTVESSSVAANTRSLVDDHLQMNLSEMEGNSSEPEKMTTTDRELEKTSERTTLTPDKAPTLETNDNNQEEEKEKKNEESVSQDIPETTETSIPTTLITENSTSVTKRPFMSAGSDGSLQIVYSKDLLSNNNEEDEKDQISSTLATPKTDDANHEPSETNDIGFSTDLDDESAATTSQITEEEPNGTSTEKRVIPELITSAVEIETSTDVEEVGPESDTPITPESVEEFASTEVTTEQPTTGTTESSTETTPIEVETNSVNVSEPIPEATSEVTPESILETSISTETSSATSIKPITTTTIEIIENTTIDLSTEQSSSSTESKLPATISVINPKAQTRRPPTVHTFPQTPLGERERESLSESLASPILYPFQPLHTSAVIWLHRISLVTLGVLAIFILASSFILVFIGTICYIRSYHPMDRTKLSEKVGQMIVLIAILFLFTLPLLLLYVSMVISYNHVHNSICPDVQLQYQLHLGLMTGSISPPSSRDADRVAANTENCFRSEQPIQGMWMAAFIFTLASLPFIISLFKLSKYYLRMKTEYYWTIADYGTIYAKRALHTDAVYGNIYGTLRAKRPTSRPPPAPFNDNAIYGESPVYGTYSAFGHM